MAIVGKELVIAGPGREARLRDALAPVRDDYDVILVDCGPHLNELTTNALVAADGVVVVTQTKLFSVKGLGMLLDNIESARRYYNPRLRLTGVIVNGHQAATVTLGRPTVITADRRGLIEQMSAAGKTQGAIAESLGVSRATVGRVLRGEIGKLPPATDEDQLLALYPQRSHP